MLFFVSGYSSANDPEKSNDIQIAVHVAVHGSIRSVDHLGEMLKQIGKGSPLENIQLHRTKCSSIIKNLMEPALRSELIKEIGESPYSIILDESTDVSCEKHMAYMIRYYNEKLKTIIIDFLGFQELHHTTADALYTAFNEFMTEMGLKMQNLIAIGTDGANNLCGKRNSLYTLLKAEYPQIQLLKCVCHSLSLAAAKACDDLPSCLEYLLRETRNWFAHSPLRIKNYQQLYQSLHSNKQPPKLVALSPTRWLAFHAAVDSNTKQWSPLKAHFNALATSAEKCYQARTLAAMYNDETNLLYLVFLAPLLKNITDVNIIFQADNANITKVYNDLRVLLMSTARRIFRPSFLRAPFDHEQNDLAQQIVSVKFALSKADSEFGTSLLGLESIDFGQTFETLAQNIEPSKVQEVRQRCARVMVRLCQELVNRFPDNAGIVENISSFDIRSVFGQPFKPLPWELAPANVDRDEIERQRRLVNALRLEDITDQSIETLTPERLWICLLNHKNAGGQHVCKELAEFAIRALSLPISNATVERVFSIMNIVKTKLRNRMQLPMLQAITRIRLHLSVRKMCCTNFRPTVEMLKMHNSKMYAKTPIDEPVPSTSSDDGDVFDEVIILMEDDLN